MRDLKDYIDFPTLSVLLLTAMAEASNAYQLVKVAKQLFLLSSSRDNYIIKSSTFACNFDLSAKKFQLNYVTSFAKTCFRGST